MEKFEFEKLYLLEDSHWWYGGLRELILSSLEKNHSATLKILDAGCGTGGMLRSLQHLGTSYGMDISADALAMSRARGLCRIVQGSIVNIPFPDKTFDWIISSDVLYHARVDDENKALCEFHRVLKVSGKLILNLPAFEFLRSTHDRAIHTRKRYKRNETDLMLKLAGFCPEKITYRNFFLFPFVISRRIMTKNSRSSNPRSDLWKTPEPVNRMLLEMLRLENRILKWINLPYGSSVFCIARKI